MKTPKRKLICPNCEEEIIIERYRDGSRDRLQFRCPSGCTLHRQDVFYHGNVREFYRLTRWKRKNREARLRNKIRKLSRAIKEVTREDDFWRNYYKHFRKQGLLRRSILIKESGTYGQDIEGS